VCALCAALRHAQCGSPAHRRSGTIDTVAAQGDSHHDIRKQARPNSLLRVLCCAELCRAELCCAGLMSLRAAGRDRGPGTGEPPGEAREREDRAGHVRLTTSCFLSLPAPTERPRSRLRELQKSLQGKEVTFDSMGNVLAMDRFSSFPFALPYRRSCVLCQVSMHCALCAWALCLDLASRVLCPLALSGPCSLTAVPAASPRRSSRARR
jgi:hypothetical protein